MLVADFVREYALTCYTFDGNPEDRFVARLIHKFMRGRRVLDLGCGPVVPVTSLFYPAASEVVAVDRLQANLEFVIHHADELEQNVRRAIAYRRRYLSQRLEPRRVMLVKGDVTERLSIGVFDAVMNLGCFGALNNEAEFRAAVRHAYSYLRPNGTLLMVNWVGQVRRPFHFNGHVHEPSVYEPSLEEAGFRIRELHTTSQVLADATRRMGYNQIIWAVARKPG